MKTNIAAPVQRFFEEHLSSQRGLSPETICSYRDGLKLLIQFAAENCRKAPTEITIQDLKESLINKFLDHLEKDRHNSVRTRNQRLAAIHSLFAYWSTLDPRLLKVCRAALAIPFKRYTAPVLGYLEKFEIDHMLSKIQNSTPKGRRDQAAFRALYNSGARASELINMNIESVRFSPPFHVHIIGKGHKERTTPLWPETIAAIKSYLADRGLKTTDKGPLFLNRDSERLTRFGLSYLVSKWAGEASRTCPSLIKRKIGPHTFRHTTAMHLLEAGVDLNMIRSWLGHKSIQTTHTYVEINLAMKRKTLESVEKVLPKATGNGPLWQTKPDILTWLNSL